MAIINTNNISFTDVKQGAFRLGSKISRTSNGNFSDYEEGGDLEGQNPDFFVNAVEIDWNGAQIGES